MSDNRTWITVGVVLGSLFLIIWGIWIGMDINEDLYFKYLVHGSVVSVNCSDEGCSVLRRNKDQSQEWLWIPALADPAAKEK